MWDRVGLGGVGARGGTDHQQFLRWGILAQLK